MKVNPNKEFGEDIHSLGNKYNCYSRKCSSDQIKRDVVLYNGDLSLGTTSLKNSCEFVIDENKYTSKQRQRILVERIFKAIFWIFIALGIVSLIVFGATYLAPGLHVVYLSSLIVFSVLCGIGIFGLAVITAIRSYQVYRNSFMTKSLEDQTFNKRFYLLDSFEIFNFYSKAIQTEIDIYYNNKVAQEFFYNKRDIDEDEETFLSSLYIETSHWFSRVFPKDSKEIIHERVISFFKKISASESEEIRLEELYRLIEDNTFGLELVSLLGEDAEFSCGALSYVLYKILEKGLESSKKEEYKALLIGLGNRSLSLWSLSSWDNSSTPYSLKIILLAAKHNSDLNKKLSTILPGKTTTLWENILVSKNKQAIHIFLFDYGGLYCNETGDSALMVAIREGYSDLVSFLLDSGCDVLVEVKNTKNLDVLDFFSSFLSKSSKEEVERMLEMILIKANSARGISEEFQYKVLVTVLALGLNMSFLKKLTSSIVSLWAKNSFGDTLYSYALLHNHSQVAMWCLENDKKEFSNIIAESVNNPELVNIFLENSPISESLFKLMLDQGLSLSTILSSEGENVLQAMASLDNLPVLVHLFQLFEQDDFSPRTEKMLKLMENIKQAINLEDKNGNNFLHYLLTSDSQNLSSELCGELLLLLKEYNFSKLSSVNHYNQSPLIKAMINRKFIFLSFLLNIMSPLDINVGFINDNYIMEHNHPFFLWMIYYKNEPNSELVMEKMIRKGLNLNCILLPGRRTLKDICVQRNDQQTIAFLQRIHVWNDMCFLSDL